jgi:hypothetical protein
VIEQIRIQAGVNAMPKNAYNNGKQDVTYLMAIPEGATLAAIRERGYLAILGDRGQIHLSVVDRRITSETVYMWGFSGPGSAKVEGIPALAGAIGTPIDAVSHSTTPDLKPAAGHMAAHTRSRTMTRSRDFWKWAYLSSRTRALGPGSRSRSATPRPRSRSGSADAC